MFLTGGASIAALPRGHPPHAPPTGPPLAPRVPPPSRRSPHLGPYTQHHRRPRRCAHPQPHIPPPTPTSTATCATQDQTHPLKPSPSTRDRHTRRALLWQ